MKRIKQFYSRHIDNKSELQLTLVALVLGLIIIVVCLLPKAKQSIPIEYRPFTNLGVGTGLPETK